MRKFLLVSFAALALMLPGRLALATPEEDIARLEMTVKMLTSQIAQLTKEVEALKAKVEELSGGGRETVRPPVVPPPPPPGGEGPKPPVFVPPVGPPKPPTPVVPVIPGTGAAGTYKLDVPAFVDAFRKMMNGQIDQMAAQGYPPEQIQQARQQVEAQAEQLAGNVSVSIVLSPDGTCSMEASMMGQKNSAQGTWKLEGEKLSITTTHEDGVEKSPPEVKTGILKDGRITVEPTEEMPIQLILVRGG